MRLPRVLPKLAIAGVSAIVALLLAEGVSRFALARGGKPFRPLDAAAALRARADGAQALARAISTRENARDGAAAIGVLQPFFGSEREPDAGGVLEHFRSGLRPDEYTVVIVGGSVAQAFAESQGPVLKAALERTATLRGRDVTVLDFAHMAHKEPQQATRLAWLFSLGYRPDVVINLDGFNEIALAWENASRGIHPLYPSFPAWGALVQDYGAKNPRAFDLTLELWNLGKEMNAFVSFSLASRLYHSSLWMRYALARCDAFQAQRVRLQMELNEEAARFREGDVVRRQFGGPDFSSSPEAIVRTCVRGWAEGSRSIQAMCSERGILYLHVLQPATGDAGSKPLTDKEKAYVGTTPPWLEGPRLAYGDLRSEGLELAKRGEHFLDASRVFASVTADTFGDPCHLLPEGNRILGELVAKTLVDLVDAR